MAKNYKPGYYWVYFKDNIQDEWVIAEYTGIEWFLIRNEDPYEDSDFHEIGPKIERNF